MAEIGITIEDIQKKIDEQKELIASLSKRLGELDNHSRVSDSSFEEIDGALKESSETLQVLNMAMQNLFYTQSQDQILIETMVRYFAGYEVGDFTKEMAVLSEQIDKGQEPEGFTVKPRNDFNATRFYDLAKEIGETFAEIRKKKIAKTKQEYADKQAKELRKPKIEIVRNIPGVN